MQYCPECGNQLPDRASFCAQCGRALAPAHTPSIPASDTPASGEHAEADEPQQGTADIAASADTSIDEKPHATQAPTLAAEPVPNASSLSDPSEADEKQAQGQTLSAVTSASESEARTVAFPAFEEAPGVAPQNSESTVAFPAFEQTPDAAQAVLAYIDASKPAQASLPTGTALHTEAETPVPQTPFPHETQADAQARQAIPQTPVPDEIAEPEPHEQSIAQMPFPGKEEEAAAQAPTDEAVVQAPSPGASEAPEQAAPSLPQTPRPAEDAEQAQDEKPIEQIPFPDDVEAPQAAINAKEEVLVQQTPVLAETAEPEKDQAEPAPSEPFSNEPAPLSQASSMEAQNQPQTPPLDAISIPDKQEADGLEESAAEAQTVLSTYPEPEDKAEFQASSQESSLLDSERAAETVAAQEQEQKQLASSAQRVGLAERSATTPQEPAEPLSENKAAPIEQAETSTRPDKPSPVEQAETVALTPAPEIKEQPAIAKPQPSATEDGTVTPRIAETRTPVQPASALAPAERSRPQKPESKAPGKPPTQTRPTSPELAEQETLVVPAIRKVAQARSAGQQNYAVREKVPSRGDRYEDLPAPGRGEQASKPAPKAVRTIGGLIWSLISPIFKRAHDPEPERPGVAQPQASQLGWLPIFALSSAFGLFTVSTAFNAARALTPGAELYYWLGIGLIYLPIVIRLIMPQASRAERVGLLAIAAICLFLTKVELSPLFYSGYDEFLHWRSINDILSTNHLLTKNPLLPVSPFYPGLEIVASAVSRISGMTSIQAGFTVVGTSCLLMVISLFLLAETLTGSARLASIAAAIFMANPHFLFFDTQFAYESLALPLATVVMLSLARYEAFNRYRVWIMVVAWTVLLAMDLTHHATNFVFEGLFLLWAIVYLFLRPLPLHKSLVIRTTIVGIALTVTTVLVIGNTVIGYFTSFFSDISAEVAKDLGSAGGNSRQLFGGAGTAIPTPLWERLISLGSVGLITLAIPFLLLCFWRRYRRNSLLWVFAIVITFYPVLQVLRLTTSGAEISDRASSFIFIAISILGAIAIVQFWPVRLLNWKHATVISAVILILFMGGIILGEGIPPTFMPGPYLASADSRSIDPEGIEAALWANTYLGPNKRMYTDRINQLLMSVYGDQYLVTKIGDNIDVTDVIFDTAFTNADTQLLQEGQVHYLAIDLRLSTQLPQDGFYYEQGEASTGPNGDTVAINRECLTKFDGVPGINRLFDSGNIAVYDTGGLINAPPIP